MSASSPRDWAVASRLIGSLLFCLPIGPLQARSHPPAAVKDARQNTTQYQYDTLNRQIAVTYPDQTTSTTACDNLGRAISKTDQGEGDLLPAMTPSVASARSLRTPQRVVYSWSPPTATTKSAGIWRGCSRGPVPH